MGSPSRDPPGLRPGRDAGTRVKLGSPEVPLLAQRRRRRLQDESDDELFFTPKTVRESAGRSEAGKGAAHAAPATFEMPTSVSTQLKERASPHKVGAAGPRLLPEEEMRRAHRSSQAMMHDLPYAVDPSVPLPPACARLLELHAAVEQSLLVHVATNGAPGAESFDEEGSPSGATVRRVRLPNLISFTALRPMVERASRRSLDLHEFRRLVWLWANAVGAPSSAAPPSTAPSPGAPPPSEVRGMGFIVSRMRTLDSASRKRVYDWGIGIELVHNRPSTWRRPATPPLEVSYGPPQNTVSPGAGGCAASSPSRAAPVGPPQTPPRRRQPSNQTVHTSPAQQSPARSPARDDMSNIAVWNHGLEERRAELAHRLRRLVAHAHHTWLQDTQRALDECPLRTASDAEQGTAPIPKTPAKGGEMPAGYQLDEHGLLTPAATRTPGGHTVRYRYGMDDGGTPPTSPLATRSRAAPLTPPRPSTPPSDRALPQTPPVPTSPLAGRSRNAQLLTPESPPQTKRRIAPPSPAPAPAPPAPPTLTAWHPVFLEEVLPELAPVPLAKLPVLNTPAPRAPRAPQAAPVPAAPTGAPSADRPLTLEERIRAKEEARNAAQAARAASGGAPGVGATLKERATLSRLAEMAEAVYMLSSSSAVPAARTAHGRQTRMLAMHDVLSNLEKSSKIALSRAESRDAVSMLVKIAPEWLATTQVGGREWLRVCSDPAAGITLRSVREKIRAAMRAANTEGQQVLSAP